MIKYSYLLLLLLSLGLISCIEEGYSPSNYLCTCNIDGSGLQVAGANGRDARLLDAVFTGDGRKLTDGARFMNFDGTDYNAVFLTPRNIRDYCFNSTGTEYYCISYADDGFPSGLVKYNVLEDSYESISETIDLYNISISQDDNLLAVTNESKVYIIDIPTKIITKEFELASSGKVIFANNDRELYFKDSANIADPIKSINLTSLEIKIIASHGGVTRHNRNRTRFVYIYNDMCEMLEIDGGSSNVRFLSYPGIITYKPSINRQGDLVVYNAEEGLIINYVDTIGEVLLREGVYNGVISPTGDKYLFYESSKYPIEAK